MDFYVHDYLAPLQWDLDFISLYRFEFYASEKKEVMKDCVVCRLNLNYCIVIRYDKRYNEKHKVR